MKTIFAFILVLAPLVFIHELGHFLAAKLFRIGVPVFSLGFGPRLFGFRRAETDYRLSLVPLGGYVRLSGDESDEHRTGAPEEFLSRPKWQRFVVFVAGATFNIVLAFFALWLFFGAYGKTEAPEAYPTVFSVEQGSEAESAGFLPGDRIVEIGASDVKQAEAFRDAYVMEIMLSPGTVVPVAIVRDDVPMTLDLNTGVDPRDGSGSPGWSLTRQGDAPAVVGSVAPGDPADRAGLQAGDVIVAAGEIEGVSQVQLQMLLQASPEKALPLRVRRGEATLDLTVTPRLEEGRGGWIGIGFRPTTVRRDLSVGEAAMESLRENVALSKTIFVVLKRLVTQEVSLKTMSGPIGIAQFARSALDTGPDALLYMLGFFSLQLGILNLLPIPVLDGGHILLLVVESVMRRELPERLKERVMQVGLVFLLTFMAVVIFLDVKKIL